MTCKQLCCDYLEYRSGYCSIHYYYYHPSKYIAYVIRRLFKPPKKCLYCPHPYKTHRGLRHK